MSLRKNKYYIILACFFILASCEKDDSGEKTCTINEWAGTYAGTGTCIGKTEKIRLSFRQGPLTDELLISDGKTEKAVKFVNCTAQITEDTPLFAFPVTGTAELKGDSLKLTASTLFGLSCSTTIMRE